MSVIGEDATFRSRHLFYDEPIPDLDGIPKAMNDESGRTRRKGSRLR